MYLPYCVFWVISRRLSFSADVSELTSLSIFIGVECRSDIQDWSEGYKYCKCLAQRWLEPIRFTLSKSWRPLVYTRFEKTAPVIQNGPCPSPPVSLSRPAFFTSSSLWLALVNFEPNISRIYTPQLQSWLSILGSAPIKMERLLSSEMSALKAQTPGDYPKKHNTVFNTRRNFKIKNMFDIKYIWASSRAPILNWSSSR